MVLPPETPRGPVSSRLWPIVLVALLIATFVVPAAALVSPATPTPVLSSHPTRAMEDRLGAHQLTQAIDSLSLGAGPAHGLRAHCSATGGLTAQCGAGTLPLLAHPSVSNPYGWLNASASSVYGDVGPSVGASMAWDAADQIIVYFGGCDTLACPDNQTWAFYQGLWYNITNPSQSPPAVYLASMDFDYLANAVVLFGGCGAYICPDNETWTFTMSSGWIDVSGPVSFLGFTYWPPAPRQAATMAFANDSSDNVTVLFGGCLDISCSAIDGNTWEWFGPLDVWFLQTASGPSPRWGASMVFDNATQSTVLFGGCASTSTCGLNDTWSFFSGAWANVSGYVLNAGPAPSGRGGFEMTYDTSLQEILLIGGLNDTMRVTNDTWALYCFFVCGWVNITPTDNLPNDIYYGAIAGESSSYAPLIYGGYCLLCATGPYQPGTWVYEPTLTINPAITPNPAPARTAVDFSSNAAGGSAPYYPVWSYGDGSTGYTDGPHNYTMPGTYAANVTVWDGYSVVANYTTTVTITGTSAVAGALPTTTDVGQSVTFSTHDPVGGTSPYAFTWGFGDGSSTSAVASPTHAYSAPGTYVANVSVVDVHGLYSNSSVTVTVVPDPTVTASATPSSVDVGTAMTFAAVPSGGTGSFTYQWNFSDGSTSTQASPTHTYSAPGTYTVHVTATDAVGGWANQTVTALVYPALVGVASATPTAVQTSATVAFSASATGGSGSYSYHWTFGDGTSGTGGTATHSYPTAGTFIAKAWINDSVGGSVVQSVTVTVTAPGGGSNNNASSNSGGLGGWALWIVLIVVIAVIALAAVMMMRRKTSPPAMSPPTGAAGGPSVPGGAATPAEWAEGPPPAK